MKLKCIENIWPFKKDEVYDAKFEGEYVNVSGILLTKSYVIKYFQYQ